MFRSSKMRLFCTTVAFIGIQLGKTPTSHAATSQFHGVNWADPNDNFGTGNLVIAYLCAN